MLVRIIIPRKGVNMHFCDMEMIITFLTGHVAASYPERDSPFSSRLRPVTQLLRWRSAGEVVIAEVDIPL